MLFPDGLSSFQVGNGAGHLEDAGLGTGGEPRFVGHYLLQPQSGAVRLAEIPYLTGCHVGVAVDLGSLETFPIISQS